MQLQEAGQWPPQYRDSKWALTNTFRALLKWGYAWPNQTNIPCLPGMQDHERKSTDMAHKDDLTSLISLRTGKEPWGKECVAALKSRKKFLSADSKKNSEPHILKHKT